MKKTAIVTGANGFIGQWLVRELTKNGNEVIAIIRNESEDISMFIDNPLIQFVYCDLEDLYNLPNLVPKKSYDLFYHLAWVAAGGSGRSDYNIQIRNVKYCCEAVNVAKTLNCKKILFAGTLSERLSKKIVEKDTIAQNDVYAICKDFAHSLIHVECKKKGIEYVWMQFANVFGPYSVNGNIVGYTISELLSDNTATFGPSDQIYDLIYIEDLVNAAYRLGMSKKAIGYYYVGTGTPRLLKEYLLEIGEILKKTSLIKIGARQDDGTRYSKDWYDISKLTRDTGFISEFEFKEGIVKTIDWMKLYLNKK